MSHPQELMTQLAIAKRTDRAKSKTPGLAVRLSQSYACLLRGFTWIGSEGDDPFHTFSAPFDKTMILTPETFRAAAGIGASWKIEIEPAAPWFDKMIQYFHDGQYGSDDDHSIELVYRHLQAAMTATVQGPLSLASVHYTLNGGSATFHKARYYVFGRVAEGGLA